MFWVFGHMRIEFDVGSASTTSVEAFVIPRHLLIKQDAAERGANHLVRAEDDTLAREGACETRDQTLVETEGALLLDHGVTAVEHVLVAVAVKTLGAGLDGVNGCVAEGSKSTSKHTAKESLASGELLLGGVLKHVVLVGIEDHKAKSLVTCGLGDGGAAALVHTGDALGLNDELGALNKALVCVDELGLDSLHRSNNKKRLEDSGTNTCAESRCDREATSGGVCESTVKVVEGGEAEETLEGCSDQQRRQATVDTEATLLHVAHDAEVFVVLVKLKGSFGVLCRPERGDLDGSRCEARDGSNHALTG
mmetsp:Transcript_10557/g.20786  ORF Transcript_10557/g.20786 Transcript_10557/m.20786 type:complete len:308 (+) Transcript_10557:330-1253(+)